jgi:hypothetical protein
MRADEKQFSVNRTAAGGGDDVGVWLRSCLSCLVSFLGVQVYGFLPAGTSPGHRFFSPNGPANHGLFSAPRGSQMGTGSRCRGAGETSLTFRKIRLDIARLKLNCSASYCATINSRRAEQVVPGNRQVACHLSSHVKF